MTESLKLGLDSTRLWTRDFLVCCDVIFLIFLRVASTLYHDDVTSFTCSVHATFSLSQVPNNLNFTTLSTVLSFKVRGGVDPSRLCTLDICSVGLTMCLVLVSLSRRLLSAAHDLTLLRVFFTLSTQTSRSFRVTWCSTVVSSAYWKQEEPCCRQSCSSFA